MTADDKLKDKLELFAYELQKVCYNTDYLMTSLKLATFKNLRLTSTLNLTELQADYKLRSFNSLVLNDSVLSLQNIK